MTRAAVAVAALVAAAPARAEHDHHHHHDSSPGTDPGAGATDADADSIVGTLGVIGARFSTPLYTGDYQGVDAGARWGHGWFGLAVRVPAYRLQRNGEVIYGLGDVLVHGDATLVARGAVAAGVVLGASAPSGDDRKGLGMGHVMVMASGWVGWRAGRVELAASAGFGRALGDAAAHAEHGGGAWPLVDPMGSSELTFGASADVAVARSLTLGAGTTGAIALPRDDGDDRLTAGVHVIVASGRFTTTAALDAGIVGDPYEYRGTVSTAVRFR